MKLRYITQLTEENQNDGVQDWEAHLFYGWIDDPIYEGKLLIVERNQEPSRSGWDNQEVPGRNNDAFNKFHIEFKYED